MRWQEFVRYVRPLQPVARRHTPQAWHFFRGMVAGSGLPQEALFAVNCFDLLDNRYSKTGNLRHPASRCTTILYRGSGQAWMAHTEEWVSEFSPYLTLISVRLLGHTFSALTFPAELPGYAAGCNSNVWRTWPTHSRLTVTAMVWRSRFFCSGSISRPRGCSGCSARSVVCGSSVTVNFLDATGIGFVERRREGKCYSVQRRRGGLIHTNHAVAGCPFAGTEVFSVRRSQARFARATALLQLEAVRDAARARSLILSDTHGQYPIYNRDVLARCSYDYGAGTAVFTARRGQPVAVPFGANRPSLLTV